MLQQYRNVLSEEDQVFSQKRKFHDEYVSTQVSFVNQYAIAMGASFMFIVAAVKLQKIVAIIYFIQYV